MCLAVVIMTMNVILLMLHEVFFYLNDVVTQNTGVPKSL